MRNKLQSINVYIPINLGDLDVEFKNNILEADRIRAIFHQLYLVRIGQSDHSDAKDKSRFSDGWIPLNSKKLRKIATKNYSKYIKWMEEKGYLIRKVNEMNGIVTKNYLPNVHTFYS